MKKMLITNKVTTHFFITPFKSTSYTLHALPTAFSRIMQGILAADKRILKDPEAQIALAELADSSVNFVVRPWVKSGDYWTVKCNLNERIKLAFDKNGISIPYPQMDVHMNSSD